MIVTSRRPLVVVGERGHMVVGLSMTATTRPSSGRTVGGKEGGEGDADVEDVDVKTDWEGIALPSSYPVYRDGDEDVYGYGYGFGD